MRSYLMPDALFDHYYDLTPAYLLQCGVRVLLLDIDNTLVPYEQPVPDSALRAWLGALADAGIAVAFVSNNHADRVTLFNRELGLPAYPDAKKPLKRTVLHVLHDLGASRGEAAIMGDQIFTDVYAAKRVGMRAYLVPPIRDKRDWLTRCKRLLEKPIIKRYQKKNRKGIEKND